VELQEQKGAEEIAKQFRVVAKRVQEQQAQVTAEEIDGKTKQRKLTRSLNEYFGL